MRLGAMMDKPSGAVYCAPGLRDAMYIFQILQHGIQQISRLPACPPSPDQLSFLFSTRQVQEEYRLAPGAKR